VASLVTLDIWKLTQPGLSPGARDLKIQLAGQCHLEVTLGWRLHPLSSVISLFEHLISSSRFPSGSSFLKCAEKLAGSVLERPRAADHKEQFSVRSKRIHLACWIVTRDDVILGRPEGGV
jgi:hypothetical protein